jgi:ubiquitin-conjugating enzyme (huntingtin interacting protein 2)
MMLQALLASPEVNDPQDAVVAELLKRDPEAFAIKANQWAHDYAKAPRQDYSLFNEGGSGGSTNESLRKSQQAAKEARERESKTNLAEYVYLHCRKLTN